MASSSQKVQVIQSMANALQLSPITYGNKQHIKKAHSRYKLKDINKITKKDKKVNTYIKSYHELINKKSKINKQYLNWRSQKSKNIHKKFT